MNHRGDAETQRSSFSPRLKRLCVSAVISNSSFSLYLPLGKRGQAPYAGTARRVLRT